MSTGPIFIYPFYPHYREAVFRELAECGGATFVLGDAPPPSNQMATGNARELGAVTAHVIWKRNLLLWQSGMLRSLRASRGDWVVFLGSVNYPAYFFLALVARYALRRKVAFWTIGWHRPERGLKRYIRLAFYRSANMLLLYGAHARDIGVAMGYPGSRLHVVGNSVAGGPVAEDPTLFLAQGRRERLRFGAVVRLNRAKRLDLLIEATSLLNRSGVAAEVQLVGEGPERGVLLDLARRLNVKLTITPPVYSDKELTPFYAGLTATVVPDAAGLTVIQSLRFGVPAISHDDLDAQMPEAEAIREGITGWSFRRGDVRSLARAMLLAEQEMRERPCEIAESCHSEIRRAWTPEASSRRILDALLGLSEIDVLS